MIEIYPKFTKIENPQSTELWCWIKTNSEYYTRFKKTFIKEQTNYKVFHEQAKQVIELYEGNDAVDMHGNKICFTEEEFNKL